MKNLYLTLFLLLYTSHLQAKCTPEQFDKEYKVFFNARTEYLKSKKDELDNQIEKVKQKKGLSDKAAFDYRISVLQDTSILAIKNKEPDIDLLDLFQLKQKGKCGKLMNYHKELAKLADKQWDIIFSNISKEIN